MDVNFPINKLSCGQGHYIKVHNSMTCGHMFEIDLLTKSNRYFMVLFNSYDGHKWHFNASQTDWL